MKPRGIAFRAGYIASTLLLAGIAVADEWRSPTKEHRSESRLYVLKVNNGAKTLTLKQDTGNGFAVKWSIKYPQKQAPVVAYITENGRYVVLRDVWHGVGYGKSLVFIGPAGKVLETYEIKDFLDQEEILYAPHTVSSLWWSMGGTFFFDDAQRKFQLITVRGTIVSFDLQSGAQDVMTVALRGAIQNGVLPEARRLLASDSLESIQKGIEQIARLKDRESVPRLKELMYDPADFGKEREPGQPVMAFDMQRSAGSALSVILGADAAPVFEVKIANANSRAQSTWIDLLEEIGAAGDSRSVLEVAEDEGSGNRIQAIKAILENGGNAALRTHPEWLSHVDEDVRFRAVKLLPVFGDSRDYDHLMQALDDEDTSVSIWALRGIINLDPPDLVDVLSEIAEAESHNWYELAVIELAKHGDSKHQARLVEWMSALTGDREGRSGLPFGLFDVELISKALAESQPPGAAEALTKASSIEEPLIKIPALGGLAAMGDDDALIELRQLTREGKALDRRRAIKWIGYCKDTGFIPELTAMLDDREPWIRDAARAALVELGVAVPNPPKTATMSLAGTEKIALNASEPTALESVANSGDGAEQPVTAILAALGVLAVGAAVLLVRRRYLRYRA
ncbi:MAG: hypothetical protein IH944_09500 [Armatimonadetes bacterium]|nr:hypothetical protein [Armatimonadota bacterium]